MHALYWGPSPFSYKIGLNDRNNMNYKCKSGESNILINNYYISNISHYYLTKIKKF